ncbi:MAG TPA: thioredoxin domain-containing protein [Cyclobacteriaceae bacterium]|nr:thioredoxin domain-containing protein [Cytophagales bacterium]HNT49214.1 thioredoxin domain-containing protein [Cyclobacteriaceae bacterium]HRE68756.1 thioredoxin domain-containing protein [Cyclobacteriaceae bacterium]HRF34162.1 thioredoxin domain-containing protein [Cyclobacteriaceae bacterium]
MPNRLIHATSPYLLQHAHNPVEWFEWSNEALQKAKQEDKPILVSIGYSSCHWCHVMERESFENNELAALMNEYFVCIKVDREERPDIDQVYMEAVQAMQQHGGWPLNVFLTPDQKPFYGGTYFPPAHWAQLLRQINQTFQVKRKEINESANDLARHLQTSDLKRFAQQNETVFKREQLDAMFQILLSRYDKIWGGIEKAPKFVMPSIWLFLLRYHAATKNKEALEMVTHTLRQLALGGIYDQVGGGFARYSVDGEWFAPHFEKMLYDNAQLISLYAEAFSITHDPIFKESVIDTIDWLKREMHHLSGGFYSALDADSEGVEGKFYTWTAEELQAILGDDTENLMQHFQATAEGNWEHGRNILRRNPQTTTAEADEIKNLKAKLLTARSKRIRPALDNKILTGWNAMLIHGLTDCYKAFQDEHFLHLALGAISFLEEKLISDKVYRTWKGRRSETEGFLEDYAFLIQAYTSLYQVTFNEGWLYKAKTWTEYVQQHFTDKEEGFFFYSSNTAEALIARKKEIFDNVIPGSNSVMARNLHTLGFLLDREDWKEQARSMTNRLLHLIATEPVYTCHWAVLLSELILEPTEIVITGTDALLLREQLHQHYLPFSITAGGTTESLLPLLEGRAAKNKTLIYVCRNKTCQLPVTTVTDTLEQVRRL